MTKRIYFSGGTELGIDGYGPRDMMTGAGIGNLKVRSQTYQTVGSFTHQMQEGTLWAEVEVLGAGGSSGRGSNSEDSNRTHIAISGGGGEYAKIMVSAERIRERDGSFIVVVGRGGVCPPILSFGQTGAKGDYSSFDDALCEGGSGGRARSHSSTAQRTGAKGGGPTANGLINTTLERVVGSFSGEAYATDSFTFCTPGGATQLSNMQHVKYTQNSNVKISQSPYNSSFYGVGGNGYASNLGTNTSGNNGGSGVVVILEFYMELKGVVPV